MGLPQQRERITVDGLRNFSLNKHDDYLTEKDYNDIMYLNRTLSNSTVRKWYIRHTDSVSDKIDTSLPIEQQAIQACELRNQFRTQARELMRDQELRKSLDETDPNLSFEEILTNKMERKEMTREEAIRDILKTASKTNKDVDKEFGL